MGKRLDVTVLNWLWCVVLPPVGFLFAATFAISELLGVPMLDVGIVVAGLVATVVLANLAKGSA